MIFSATKPISFLTFSGFFVSDVSAQEFSYGRAFEIVDSDAVTGDIIARNDSGQYVRANIALSNQLIGVISDDVTILYEESEGVGIPVILGGSALVNVSSLNGDISIGDPIIASPIEGKGQRATNLSGFIIGTALSPFTASEGTSTEFEGETISSGTIRIAVEPRPLGPTQAGALTNFVDQLSNLVFRSAQTPQQSEVLFRYLAAAIIAAVAIGVSFRAFGGSISNGIEAMGRNPLARRQIQTAIIINAGLILLISIGGFILSLAILQF